jgi:acyl-CoA hydrolase
MKGSVLVKPINVAPSDRVGAVVVVAVLVLSLGAVGTGGTVAQDGPVEGSLTTDVTPGETGVGNNYTFTFDASGISDERSIHDIWIDLDKASGVDTAAISEGNVSIEGETIGTPGVDATTESLPGILRVTAADTFTLADEDGVLTVTISGVEVPNDGTYSVKVAFLDEDSAAVALGTDGYTIDDGSQDPAAFDVGISDTTSPVTEGEPLQVEATVENVGDESDTQTVGLSVDGLGSDDATVSLSGGESTTATFTLETRDGDAGSYTATVASDDDTASSTVEVEAEAGPEEGPLTIDVRPGEAAVTNANPFTGETGVENEFTFAFDASGISDERTIHDIWIDFDEASGVDAAALSADDVSVEGETVGTLGVDATREEATGVLRVTAADTFTLAGEDGVLAVTATGVEVPTDGTFDGRIEFLDAEGDVIAFGTDGYTMHESSQDPAAFDVGISDTTSPVTEGEPLQVEATIENVGDTSATQTVGLSVDGLGSDDATVSLSGGESTTETFTLETRDGDAGSYTATVASDDDTASSTVEVEADTEEGPLTVDAEPGEAGVKNEFTFAFDASGISDERTIHDIWIDVDEASGVDAAAISADDVSVEGETVGTLGVDAATEDVPGVLRVTAADALTLADEDGVLTVTISGVEVPNDGTFSTEVAFLDDEESAVVAFGTDGYAIDEGSQDPAAFDVEISDTTSPVTEGEPLQVEATIENVGDTSATQTVELSADGPWSDDVTVSLSGGESTTATFTLETRDGDAGSHTVTVASDDDTASTTVKIEVQGGAPPDFGGDPQPVVGEALPHDLDDDGVYEDIDGDGEFSIGDVQDLLQHRDADAVRNHPELFAFDGDNPSEVTREDVRALFAEFVDQL